MHRLFLSINQLNEVVNCVDDYSLFFKSIVDHCRLFTKCIFEGWWDGFRAKINIRMYNETMHVNVTTNNREWFTNETKGNVLSEGRKKREENNHWTDEGQLLAQIISYRFINRDIIIDMYRREKINCVLINCTYFYSSILSDLDVPVDF